jgi:ribokinase
MTAGFEIIVCGSLHLDIVLAAPLLPRVDETVVGTSWKKICGGKGGNQAVMAARAGAKCAMIGRVGNDDFGKMLTDNLKNQNVNIDSVSIDPAHGTGMSAAILQDDGEYGAVIVSGSNLALQPDDAAAAWQNLGSAKYLILQNEVPEPVNIAVAQTARKSGAHVILNAAPARKMSERLLQLVDLLIVNRIEAEMLSGITISDAKSALALLPKLALPNQMVVITMGGMGLVFQTRDSQCDFIAPHKVDVKSAHGAGDCFVGALAQSLTSGEDLPSACSHANLVAAQFVSGKTAEPLF